MACTKTSTSTFSTAALALQDLFPPAEGWIVFPQYPLRRSTYGYPDFIVRRGWTLVVEIKRHTGIMSRAEWELEEYVERSGWPAFNWVVYVLAVCGLKYRLGHYFQGG